MNKESESYIDTKYGYTKYFIFYFTHKGDFIGDFIYVAISLLI